MTDMNNEQQGPSQPAEIYKLTNPTSGNVANRKPNPADIFLGIILTIFILALLSLVLNGEEGKTVIVDPFVSEEREKKMVIVDPFAKETPPKRTTESSKH
jgi:hypothetical protein